MAHLGKVAVAGALLTAAIVVVLMLASPRDAGDVDEAATPVTVPAITSGDDDPLGSASTLPSAAPSPLPFPGSPLPVGGYSTDLLGLPLSFQIDEPTALRTARDNLVVVTPEGWTTPRLDTARHFQFVRVGGWNDRTEAVDAMFQGIGSIAPDDIEMWFEVNDVVVDASDATTIAGRPAAEYRIRVDPASELGHGVCPADARPCFWFVSPAESESQSTIRSDEPLFGSMSIRLWLIEIDGAAPLLIHAATPEGDEAWLDRLAATVVTSLEIG